MTDESLIKQIADRIEVYHQEHFWNLFPAGTIPPWVYVAVAENIVKPLQEEINMLKATDVKKAIQHLKNEQHEIPG